MTKLSTLHKRWSQDADYKKAFDAYSTEFELARQVIETRIKSGLSQEELAQKMGTSQSSIARLESGASLPSIRTLMKFAEATDSEIQISFKRNVRRKATA